MSLFINDKFVAKNNDILSVQSTIPLIKINYQFDSGLKTIEIFCNAIFTVKIKIYVNKEHIGGEIF